MGNPPEDPKTVRLNVRLAAPDTWVSWVGCVRGVLDTYDLKSDAADVAGMSGYAFLVNVHPELCPSGPTAFDWSFLVEGFEALGVEAELASVCYDGEMPAELTGRLFERVREEVGEGRPCVVWGATCSPEFAVVYGHTEDAYLVRSFRTARTGATGRLGPGESPEEPVPHDKLQSPGCVGGFFFGRTAGTDPDRADRAALSRAVRLLRGEHPCFEPEYEHGSAAFGTWARTLESGKFNPMGNAYNAACYEELAGFASTFLGRLARRHAKAADYLDAAAEEATGIRQDLGRVAELFPFPAGGDPNNRVAASEAAKLLRDCENQACLAQENLSRCLALV